MLVKILKAHVEELRSLDSQIIKLKQKLKVLESNRLEEESVIIKGCKLHPEGETVLYPKRRPLLKASSSSTAELDRDFVIKLVKAGSSLVDHIKFSTTMKESKLFAKGVSFKFSKVSVKTI